MDAATTVFNDMKAREITLAKNQPEYNPLTALMGDGNERRMTLRMIPTPEERAAIAAGADVMITVLTFRQPFQPILVWCATQGDVHDNEEAREILGC